MLEIYAIKLLSEKKFEFRERILSLLDENRRKRILKFVFPNDAQRSLLGDLMVRAFISKELNLKNSRITFNLSDKGKPYLTGYPNLFFNVSHAGEWVVVAFSENNIGIDVERIKKINYNVAELFFSKEENLNLNNLSGKEKLEYFFDLWTMKESYLKYTGKGLSEPLNSFTVEKTGSKLHLSHPSSKEKVFLKQYELDKGYKLSVCSSVNDFPESIRHLKIDEC
ncbi:MAG: 4'-phosphopantetheinyl transferase superfamily protein, partial [Bacteroidales bacterium]|nr:4'-phosphopantetheinyl transferase superfamily protein [Bacteroidales bacterium]